MNVPNEWPPGSSLYSFFLLSRGVSCELERIVAMNLGTAPSFRAVRIDRVEVHRQFAAVAVLLFSFLANHAVVHDVEVSYADRPNVDADGPICTIVKAGCRKAQPSDHDEKDVRGLWKDRKTLHNR